MCTSSSCAQKTPSTTLAQLWIECLVLTTWVHIGHQNGFLFFFFFFFFCTRDTLLQKTDQIPGKSGSFTCVIWGLCKLAWQLSLTSYNLSNDLKRGKRERCQLVKLTSLSSGRCHRKWDLSPTKKICRRQPAIFFWESLSRQRRCLREFSVLFLRVVVCLKNVLSDGQDVKYDRDITPCPHVFHSTNSREATQVVHRKLG